MIIANENMKTKVLAGTVLLTMLAVLFVISKMDIETESGASAEVPVTEVSSAILGYSLLDHNGDVITSELFLGKWSFVFFGFTNCPDVCPATLSQLVQLNKLIRSNPDMAGKFQTLFVSVDPDRDGTQHIKDYVKYFDQSFIGATGEMENIVRFEQQFGAFHVITDKSRENYNVGHTASVFLVNPDGVVTSKISPPMDVTLVAEQLQGLVLEFSSEK